MDPRPTGARDVGPRIRQTADLRRLCVSLRNARAHDGEAVLLAEFEAAMSQPERAATVNPEVLRAAFRNLWRQADYDRIVTVGHTLPVDLLHADEIVAMYYMCAMSRLGR